jgi:hypothetical protein
MVPPQGCKHPEAIFSVSLYDISLWTGVLHHVVYTLLPVQSTVLPVYKYSAMYCPNCCPAHRVTRVLALSAF